MGWGLFRAMSLSATKLQLPILPIKLVPHTPPCPALSSSLKSVCRPVVRPIHPDIRMGTSLSSLFVGSALSILMIDLRHFDSHSFIPIRIVIFSYFLFLTLILYLFFSCLGQLTCTFPDNFLIGHLSTLSLDICIHTVYTPWVLCFRV